MKNQLLNYEITKLLDEEFPKFRNSVILEFSNSLGC